MKLDLSYMNLEELKIYLLKCKDPLIKASLNRALFDTFRDSKITSVEYLDITLETIKNETDEDTVSLLLRYISSVIKNYLPLKYMPQYKNKCFDILKKIMENQLSSINCNKEIIKNILIYLNGFAIEDDDKKYLINY